MLMILGSDRGMNKKIGTWVRGMSVIGNVHRLLLVRASGSEHFVGVLTPLCFIPSHSLPLSHSLALSLCGSGLS